MTNELTKGTYNAACTNVIIFLQFMALYIYNNNAQRRRSTKSYGEPKVNIKFTDGEINT
jgi:hypothetical protein